MVVVDMKAILMTCLAAVLSVAACAADMAFLKELVEIPSASSDIPQVNRAMRAMKDYLEKRGLWCAIETTPEGKDVLFAATERGKAQDYVLSCHLDVVPAAFEGQYSVRAEGDKIYGRGVYDCKGACVSVVAALERLKGKASVGCIFGADEELGGFTTTWMVTEKGYVPRKMVIVVDGKFREIAYAQKGQCMIRVKAKGRGGHSSAPWKCDDSITRLMKAYVKIREIWDERHPLAPDKWSDVLTPTIVRSEGEALNRIPSDVELVLNLRSVNPGAKDEAMELVREVTGYEVELVRYSPPCNSDPNHPLMRGFRKAYATVLGSEIGLQRNLAAADARCFVTCGVPIAIVGINGGDPHGANEWAEPASFDQMADVLVRFLSDPSAYADPLPTADKVSVTAAGDAFMVQRFPEGFAVDPKLKDWIASGDARLVNFEAVVNDGTCSPAAWSGGTWSSMAPDVFPDLLAFGFNGCGCANNHSLDYTVDGLRLTMKTLSAAKMPFAGIGEDLQGATAPAFVETPAGKVAFVSVNAEFHPDAMAGWTTSRSKGRPGVNALRHTETLLVNHERMEQLKGVAAATAVNATREFSQMLGFLVPDPPGIYKLGKLTFRESEKEGRTSACNENDLKRITEAIAEARRKAVAVVVLAHSHDMRWRDCFEPDAYFEEFCRAAVDAGADAVIGGGTHQLKGIEFRNGKPIFYSLGDFVFQNNVVPTCPPDFCEQYGVALDSPAEVAFNARSRGGKVGLHTIRDNFLSVVPKIELEKDRVVRVTMLPIELHFAREWSLNGLPRSADAEATKVIADTLARLSAPFGTSVTLREDGILVAAPR